MKADGPRVHNRMDLFTIKEQLCAKEIFFVEDRKPDDAPDLQQAKHDERCPEIRSHLDRIPQLGATDQEILHWYQGLVLDMPLPEPSPHLDEARDSGSLS
ncbi:hypothetical protein FOZ63_026122 [Perkinsus olseni]|uniref:Uncharacterized protein n=1 Tax=Perkinsus olseni TaxID=32597 RepID=A0A7J6U010_PEROL|nr:hypothetical protein FOZ63_026122 [Perkinsus olseni]